MMTTSQNRFKVHSLIARIILVVGILLLSFSVVVESEPGAIPLLLIAAGLFGIFRIKYKKRSANQSEKEKAINHS